MKFTFGIITGGNNLSFIQTILDSIYSQIPEDCFQIVLVGGESIEYPNLLHIPFDENEKPMWITKKKNLITSNALYDNIVYTHDYIALEPGWYEGQLKKGDDFNIRMDKVINYDGSRFRDWCIWPENGEDLDNIIKRQCIMPYHINYMTKHMYISGSYWIAKKSVMIKYPLNEELIWGQGEDVEWSKTVREFYDFQMNENSSVRILKPHKDKVFEYMTKDTEEKLEEYLKTKAI